MAERWTVGESVPDAYRARVAELQREGELFGTACIAARRELNGLGLPELYLSIPAAWRD